MTPGDINMTIGYKNMTPGDINMTIGYKNMTLT